MSKPNTSTTPNSTEQASTGAAGGTATPATPAAVTTPPVSAAPAAQVRQPAGKPKGKGGGNMIKIPAPAFKERIQREAMALVQKQTGLPMAKVLELVQQGGVRPAGGGQSAAQNTADVALKTARDEAEKLRKENARLAREKEDQKKKHAKELRRANDRVIEAELSALARAAGITQPRYINFAINDFAAAVRQDPTLKPEAFFAKLRETDPAFFSAAPPPPTVAATTAPPESPAQGETRPAPTPAGTPPVAPNVDDMSDQEFNAHRKKQYGFTS